MLSRMKQCACGQGNMVLTLRAPVRFSGGNIAGFFASTTRTIKAIRPLNIKKRFRTRFLGSIFFSKQAKTFQAFPWHTPYPQQEIILYLLSIHNCWIFFPALPPIKSINSMGCFFNVCGRLC